MKKLLFVALTALSLNAVAMEQLPELQGEEHVQQQQPAAANQDVYAQERKAYLDRKAKAHSTSKVGASLVGTGSTAVSIVANAKRVGPQDIGDKIIICSVLGSVSVGATSLATASLVTLPQNKTEEEIAGTSCTIL